MNYIILDLEWNQAYMQKSVAVQKRLLSRLRGEVIQIGAVKLDEQLNICGSYSIIVRPRFFAKMHRHVSLLTGITQQMADSGVSLGDACDSFRRFCGDDYAFFTWGPDDIPMLKENLNVNKLDMSWLGPDYDLQYIYANQKLGEKRQVSLEDAMENLGIDQTLPAHDALNDAYFTSLVAQKLDIRRGISEYTKVTGDALFDVTVGDADIGEEGFASFTSVTDHEDLGILTCPICKSKMSIEGATLHSKGRRYITPVKCETHGTLLLTAALSHNFNETYRIRFTLKKATEEQLSSYTEKLKIAESFRKPSKGRRRSYRRKSDKSAEKATT